MTTVNIRIEELAQQLDLEILERGKGIICFRSSEISRPGLQFAGFYDHFDPHRVQLIGNAEMNYLYSLPQDELKERMRRFMGLEIPCVVCARGKMPPEALLHSAREHQIPVFRAACNTDQAGHAISNYVERRLSRHILTHGVLMDILASASFCGGKAAWAKAKWPWR